MSLRLFVVITIVCSLLGCSSVCPRPASISALANDSTPSEFTLSRHSSTTNLSERTFRPLLLVRKQAQDSYAVVFAEDESEVTKLRFLPSPIALDAIKLPGPNQSPKNLPPEELFLPPSLPLTSTVDSQMSPGMSPEDAITPSEEVTSTELRILEGVSTGALDIESLSSEPEFASTGNSAPLWKRMLQDQANFYSPDSALNLGAAAAIGATFANTQLDQQLHDHFQSSVRGASSDGWFNFLHANKELGNGMYTLPVIGAVWVTGEAFDSSPAMHTMGDWGEKSLRGIVVGTPALLVLQKLTGGSRPGETPEGSEWHPMQDNNGVSGHAFMSALPFITAAKMTDRPLPKTLFYVGSTIGPLSRVNDNAHYPSQIGIGWALAFIAASAVQQTDTGKRGWSVVPQSVNNGNGFALQYRW